MAIDIWLTRVQEVETVNVWKDPTIRRKVADVVRLFVENYNTAVIEEEPNVNSILNYFCRMNNWAADLMDIDYVIEDELRKYY